MNVEEHLLEQFNKVNCKLDVLHEKVGAVKEEIAVLKVKSSIWGAIAGGIAAAVGIFAGK